MHTRAVIRLHAIALHNNKMPCLITNIFGIFFECIMAINDFFSVYLLMHFFSNVECGVLNYRI